MHRPALLDDLTDLIRTAASDARRRFDNTMPRRPRTINLLANDICNSRCQMCLIWKQKRDSELNVEEWRRLLAQPLFSRVTSIGITGGEPTLRRDLPNLYAAACGALPRLRGAGIITNAIRDGDVIERVTASINACRDAGKSFTIMISLDGVGEVHDAQRGRAGNFDSAMRVLRHFRQHEPRVPLYLGCTVTKTNVWHVDEVLDLAKREGVQARFRVAEFIQRLYNFGQTQYIRTFDADETYHLAAFFYKLEKQYEKSDAIRRTYRSIRGMLLGDGRRTGCPYLSDAVVVDSRGQLLYCAPKSKVLGDVLNGSSLDIYRDNLGERERIRKEDCSSCIHDYHAAATLRETIEDLREKQMRRIVSPAVVSAATHLVPVRKSRVTKPGHVLITGWYGTETVGDKAILDAIVHHYRRQNADARFTVSSLYPMVTHRTLDELGITADVVPARSGTFLRACREVDEVVMGGGPLMDLDELAIPLAAFAIAAAGGKRRTVFGCGLGPLHRPRNIRIVCRLLRLADSVSLRDQVSVAWAQRLSGRNDITCSGDPAIESVRRRSADVTVPSPEPLLACFLREWPAGYRGDLDLASFQSLRERFEHGLAREIRRLAESLHLRPAFYSMHTFFEGCDDRDFNRRFVHKHLADLDPIVERRPSSVDSIIHALRSTPLAVCMRFHSVVFADTLGVPSVAIDYTLGGKIDGYLRDHNAAARLVTPIDIAEATSPILLPRAASAMRGDRREVRSVGVAA